MTQYNPADTVRACFKAYESKDRAAIESLLGDDFRFTSPLDNGVDRNTYMERCWPISEEVEAFKLVRVVPNGRQVFVTYESTLRTGKVFRNTEVFTVSDGKISEVEVYFGWDIPHKAAEGQFLQSPS